ncbi:MAG: hybrid sensor histidine kinase/response regulator [Chloroflexi bacterium]|nr:hybrid sensor histidine kinase/response regulator [Chloroflexota bacterium]
MSILIVDDQDTVRDVLKTVLGGGGYTDIVTAESADEAFALLGLDDPSAAVSPVDLILMDVNMPEMDGVTACARLKGDPHLRDIPVIMITGDSEVSGLTKALASGAVDYITKPPNFEEMLARVGSAIQSKWEMDRRKSAYFNDLQEKSLSLELALAELEKKNEELEQASLAKTQILSTATHELKTPLTSIVGYVDRMLLRQDTVGPLNERQQRYMETVRNNAHRLKNLVDDLLDISRIEAGCLELSLRNLDLAQEIGESIKSLRTQFQEKQIRVSFMPSPDCPTEIWADQLRFAQVISNLLSNACKYSPAGTTVTISVSRQGEAAQIEVSDQGIGISQEDQAKLFTKFFRADNSFTREASGTGLGLYITKHLVEAHGGSIWVESKEGQGTTFSCLWPSAAAGSSQEDQAETEQEPLVTS